MGNYLGEWKLFKLIPNEMDSHKVIKNIRNDIKIGVFLIKKYF